ncbi:N-acetylmuramoyl-L-alanine amidase [compost metagenome]
MPEAIAVLNSIVELGFRNRGIKDGKNLYVIRKTNMTALLIECCFVDTKEDADRYNPDAIAKAIVKG